jgi:hypothetical protein
MMVLTLQLDLIKPRNNFFEDVSSKDWSYQYVETARPYLTGFRSSNGDYFRPTLNAVREEMAVAIVRGLGLDVSDVDLSILDIYTDKGQISSNLKPYVAKAIQEGIMIGSDNSFNAQGTLKRAEAATLLARLITDEKVVYDDEKVVYDGDKIEVNSKTPTFTATVKDEKVYLDWSEVASEGFKYYKVVASIDTEQPIYPTDGYLQAISDRNDTDTYIRPFDNVNGGDSAELVPGTVYHVSITAVYEDGETYASNVIDVLIPVVAPIVEMGRTPVLEYAFDDEEVVLTWSKTESDNFKYYKVVFSEADGTPVYPGDGYLQAISDVNVTSYDAEAEQSYNGGDVGGELNSGETYYVSITAVYSNGDEYYASNVFSIEMP